MLNLGGYKIAVAPEPQRVRRSWWERLFTRPWRPRQKFKTVGAECPIPKGMFLIIGDTIYIRQAELDKLKAGQVCVTQPLIGGASLN